MITDAKELIQEFANYAGTHEGENYVTLYLNVDPAYLENQSDPPAWHIFLKNAIHEIEAEQEPVQLRQWKKVRLSDTSPETAWARTRKRLEKYLTSYQPQGKTLVLFVSPTVEYEYELPVVLTNAAHFGRPHIQEFLWALDEYEQHLVLLIAEDRARAVLISLGETTAEVDVVSDEAWLREVSKSGHQANIQERDKELDRRFKRAMANQIDKFFLKNHDIQRIVLGGNTEMAHSLQGRLHPAVRDRIIAILPIPMDATPREIADRVRPTAKQAERDHEVELVNEIIGQAKAGGRGVTGYTAVQRAVERAAVSNLVLIYPAETEIAEPMLLQAVQNGVQIEFVKGPAADRLREEGSAAARLYYALS